MTRDQRLSEARARVQRLQRDLDAAITDLLDMHEDAEHDRRAGASIPARGTTAQEAGLRLRAPAANGVTANRKGASL